MFFTYLRRELRRRRKAALVISAGLALGIALVITVNSVSAGMTQAQDKVLQSLYGLGTDMTVSKAAAPPSGSSNGQPRFNFGARGDSKTQSSDRVQVQGFQTLASSTVTKVASQSGVKDAVGGLSLSVVKISGQFNRGTFKPNQNSGSSGKPGGSGGGQGGGSAGQPQGEVQGGGANFSLNQFTVYGVDVSKLGLGPLTSSKITSGKTFTSAQTNAKVVVLDSAYAKTKKLTVGKTLTISGTKFTVIGIATADSGDSAATDHYTTGGGPLLALTVSSGSSSLTSRSSRPASLAMTSSTALRPIWWAGMATEVSWGADWVATSSGQMATTETSSGTARPCWRRRASRGPMADSFWTTRAVVSGRSSNIRDRVPAVDS
jgi:hypothetical protein